MRTLERRTPTDRKLVCLACASHLHPDMVPWSQHAIGCPVRTARLSVRRHPVIGATPSGTTSPSAA